MYYAEQLGDIQIEMLFIHWSSVNVDSQDIWNTKQSALAANAGADTSKKNIKYTCKGSNDKTELHNSQ